MEILSILLILFPTIVLITINFKKNFRDINPLIYFIGFFIVFIAFFVTVWFIVNYICGEQISWIIYVYSIISLSPFIAVLLYRCLKLQISWTRKNWYWILSIAILIETYCVRFMYYMYR